MALVAEVDGHLALGGASGPRVAAGAANGALDVVRMDALLHFRTPSFGLVSDQAGWYCPGSDLDTSFARLAEIPGVAPVTLPHVKNKCR